MRQLTVFALLLLLGAAVAVACEEETAAPAAVTGTPSPSPPAREGATTLRWLGHSAFLLTSSHGTTVLMDPFADIGYGQPRLRVDVVLISHNHFDHDNARLGGKAARVIRGLRGGDWAQVQETVKGDVTISSVGTYHDGRQGRDRGKNAMFLLQVDGLRILHAGDLGHVLTPEQVAQVGSVDVLLIPVGGHFTIDAAAATQVVEQLHPKIVVPMHYQTGRLDPNRFPIATVDPFLEGKKVQRLGSNVLVLRPGELPSTTAVVVMDYQ